MMAEISKKGEIETSISVDIFTVAAAMVGVCFIVIQWIKMNAGRANIPLWMRSWLLAPFSSRPPAFQPPLP